jgi:hypothetical protein
MSADDPIRNFSVTPVPKATLLQRMTGKIDRDVAMAIIRNILATTPYRQVSSVQVNDVLRKARISAQDASQHLIGVFEHAALWLCSDKELTAGDRDDLAALQRAFTLTDAQAAEALERAAGQMITRTVRELVADNQFSKEDEQHLRSVATGLGLTDDQLKGLYASAAIAAVQDAFDRATDDRRLEPAEDERLSSLAASLDVKMVFSDATLAKVDRFRRLGKVQAGELPRVTVDIILRRGETCHFMERGIDHSELRTVTKRINYSGPTGSIRIMKGLRWRYGSVAVERIAQDVLSKIDTVDVYLTNRRLLLNGARKNSSVALDKIVKFSVFSDGLTLEKSSGRDIYLTTTRAVDWELFGACLDASLNAGA